MGFAPTDDDRSIIKQLKLDIKLSDARVRAAAEPDALSLLVVKVPVSRKLLCIKRTETTKFVEKIITSTNSRKRAVELSRTNAVISKSNMLANHNMMLFVDVDKTILLNNKDAKGHPDYQPDYEVTKSGIGKIQIQLRPWVREVVRDLESHGFI